MLERTVVSLNYPIPRPLAEHFLLQCNRSRFTYQRYYTLLPIRGAHSTDIIKAHMEQ